MASPNIKLDTDRVIDQLHSDGVFVAEGYFGAATVDRLNEEFELLCSRQFEGVKESEKRKKTGRLFRISYEKIEKESFKNIREVFFSDMLREISEQYMPKNSLINYDLIAAQNLGIIEEDRFIDALRNSHIDALRALKFMIYLMDTNEENGAFSYARGTHAINSRLRNKHLRFGGSLRALPAVLPVDAGVGFESINGSAGTLIIFDTDGVHRAGKLSEGTERRILRSRCLFPNQPAQKPSKYSRRWFWEHRLNPMKIFAPKVPEGWVGLQEWHRIRGELTSGEATGPNAGAST